jgi:hypothetical protein
MKPTKQQIAQMTSDMRLYAEREYGHELGPVSVQGSSVQASCNNCGMMAYGTMVSGALGQATKKQCPNA